MLQIYSVRITNKRLLKVLIVTGMFGAIGLTMLALSHAATSVVDSEAEDGAVAGQAAVTDDTLASGGQAIKFGASPTSANGGQPFAMPSTASLRSSPKKVFAHYFTPYPLSLDNKLPDQDYYANNYLKPSGESGAYSSVGGLLRSRPLPRQPLAGDWQLEDMKSEVRHAVDAGIDGFSADILDTSGYNWDRVNLLLKAAEQVDSGFKVMIMPDATTLVGEYSATDLGNSLATIAASKATYRLADGRIVVSPFKAEDATPAYWQGVIDAMQAKGYNVAFVPLFLDYSANASKFAAMSYGFSNWGNRSPKANTGIASLISDAHAKGKIWMQPVAPQDVRPRSTIYDEANNTENLRLSWDSTITGGADWVQLVTWNDYSEGTQVSPSSHSGYGFLDLASYYLAKFKTGTTPAIKRDALYINHRIQFAAATPASGSPNTSLMQLRSGSSPARDKVEVVSYLTAPASITVTIGNTSKTYTAQAGMQTQLFDLAYGTISAQASRNNQVVASVASPYSVNQSFQVQDLEYHMAGSNNR